MVCVLRESEMQHARFADSSFASGDSIPETSTAAALPETTRRRLFAFEAGLAISVFKAIQKSSDGRVDWLVVKKDMSKAFGAWWRVGGILDKICRCEHKLAELYNTRRNDHAESVALLREDSRFRDKSDAECLSLYLRSRLTSWCAKEDKDGYRADFKRAVKFFETFDEKKNGVDELSNQVVELDAMLTRFYNNCQTDDFRDICREILPKLRRYYSLHGFAFLEMSDHHALTQEQLPTAAPQDALVVERELVEEPAESLPQAARIFAVVQEEEEVPVEFPLAKKLVASATHLVTKVRPVGTEFLDKKLAPRANPSVFKPLEHIACRSSCAKRVTSPVEHRERPKSARLSGRSPAARSPEGRRSRSPEIPRMFLRGVITEQSVEELLPVQDGCVELQHAQQESTIEDYMDSLEPISDEVPQSALPDSPPVVQVSMSSAASSVGCDDSSADRDAEQIRLNALQNEIQRVRATHAEARVADAEKGRAISEEIAKFKKSYKRHKKKVKSYKSKILKLQQQRQALAATGGT